MKKERFGVETKPYKLCHKKQVNNICRGRVPSRKFHFATAPLFLIFSFQEVCSLHIGCGKSKCQREHFKGTANISWFFTARKTHMITYCKSFFPCKTHKARYNVYRFFTMTIRKLVFNFIGWNLLPHTVVILHIPKSRLVEVHFAKVVKQCNNSNCFVACLQTV